MNFELQSICAEQAAEQATDALLVLVPQTLVVTPLSGALVLLAHQASATGDLQAEVGKTLPCYRLPGIQASRVVLVRAGSGSPSDVAQATAAGMALLRQPQIKSLCVVLSLLPESGVAVRAAVQTCAQASYVYTSTKPSAVARALQRVVIAVGNAPALAADFEIARAALLGVELAKEWGNRPANHATPRLLAQAALDLASRSTAIKTEVYGPEEVEALGMGAFLSVARGSSEPLRFIVMRYSAAAVPQSAPVVLIGKGITFDSGGISLKPAPEMDEMKFDMCGAASVLGVFAALAQLQPAINVVGLIPSCENLPSGQALKPGDVVTSMSGQTIEILNTDAEGRLILCDALTYAARLNPRCIVDIATLTGACVIALGGVRSGLFCAHDDMAQALERAGEKALDKCWRMPLDDEYAQGLKSKFADLANVAGRPAGSVTAAKFLQKFAANWPWAHLDIAGTAWKTGSEKGATGRPVPLLLQYLVDQQSAPTAERSGGQ